MSTTTFNYLIIGQGLAGSILAHQLITNGQRVMVIDNQHEGASSEVAAGIINPVTGSRLKHTDNFELLYQYAKSYYGKLEYHIKAPIFDTIEQYRQIQNDTEHHYLEKRLADKNYQIYLNASNNKPNSSFRDHSKPLLKINHTATVDTKILLSATQQWLMSLHSYRNSKIDYADLQFSGDSIQYHDINATHLIFCEGYQAINNPWLKHLPFKLAKGEILTLDNSQKLQAMLSWGKWLVPNVDTLKLGSNFAWDDLDLTPSEQVKRDLLDNLYQHTKVEPQILNHDVGIRPSTKQRDPFVGPISQLENAYCFNGFGSKGCLLMPYYAALLSEHLLNQTSLPKNITQCL